MTQAVQAYACLRRSAVHEDAAGRRLALETSGGTTPARAVANPSFFSGIQPHPPHMTGSDELMMWPVPRWGVGRVAADCARRCAARGAIAEVPAVAGRGGSSRLVKEARALREVLGTG